MLCLFRDLRQRHDRNISEARMDKSYVPDQQEVTAEDVMGLCPEAALKIKDQKSLRSECRGSYAASLGSQAG